MRSAIDGHLRAKTFGSLGLDDCVFIPVSSLSFIFSFLFGTTELSLVCLASSALFVALTAVSVLCHL